MTFQAEDEIAAVTFGDRRSVCRRPGDYHDFGPGHGAEDGAIGLAVAVEIPLVICDIQRGGPSTGLPTKTEQADLLQALFGRNSEAANSRTLAASTPADCFCGRHRRPSRIAVKIHGARSSFFSDGYLANGAEPWRIRS